METQRLSHQNAIDAARNLSERNRLGQYPTRFDLASVIVRQALTHLEPGAALTFLEPALATGAFFSALRAEVRDTFVLARADGVEIDPKELASVVVRAQTPWLARINEKQLTLF